MAPKRSIKYRKAFDLILIVHVIDPVIPCERLPQRGVRSSVGASPMPRTRCAQIAQVTREKVVVRGEVRGQHDNIHDIGPSL